jgi:hypothetical protein
MSLLALQWLPRHAALTGAPDYGAGSVRSKPSVLAGMAGVYGFGGSKPMERAQVMKLPWYRQEGFFGMVALHHDRYVLDLGP